jgi:ankyrin repeat protein
MTATSWAATALLTALPVGSEAVPAPAPDVSTAEGADWIRTALTGNAAQLKKALDAGMNPNSKTEQGTTAVMLAAHDSEKVKLLIERGADVNARGATGFTPLMVASRYRGNSEAVRLLLKSGAKVNADKGVEVRNDASALFFAVTSGDTVSVKALLDAGAAPAPMKVLGFLVISPLNYATIKGEPSLVELLISRGANANEVDSDGISPLGWATILNHADTVRALLGRGARVNHVDKLGMTPLLYAASIDYGDTEVMQKLITAGADLRAKNKDGLTALDLAGKYKHGTMVHLLGGKSPAR